MKSKCKTCGANSDSEYCFRHKPRKALSKVAKNTSFDKGVKLKMSSFSHQKLDKSDEEIRKISELQQFFLQIWRKSNVHTCENCGKWLGKEPLSYMFDHVLEKSKYPELKYEEENIMLLCLECHDNKTRENLTDLVREKIEKVRKKFGK